MNKKAISLVSVLMILVLALAPTAALANLAHGYVKTANHGSLNMREVTTVDSMKVGTIPYGERVAIIEYLDNNTWARVEYDGKQGFVMTRYLSNEDPRPAHEPQHKPEPAEEPTDLTKMFHGFQMENYTAVLHASAPGGFVHMRWAPSKKMDIMTDYYEGKQFEVLAQNTLWCQVRDPETGKTGFMMRSFLTPVGY